MITASLAPAVTAVRAANPAGTATRFIKSRLRSMLLALFFMLSFSVQKYLPGLFITAEVWTALVLGFLVTFYLYQFWADGLVIGQLEAYGLLLLVVVPLLGAYQAHAEFGQPYWYGMVAQRWLVLNGCMMMFLYLFRKRQFSLAEVERAIVWLAWLNLGVNLILNMMVDKSRLVDQPGFSAAGLNDGNGELLLDTTFIILGFFYYAFASFSARNLRNVVCALTFLAYLVFVSGGRSALISVLASFLFFMWRWHSGRRFVALVAKMVVGLALAAAVLLVFPSEKLDRLEEKFADAFVVVATGEKTQDVSANARITEMALAAPGLAKNWLLGNGAVSNHWQGGFLGTLGYFHPTDIGLFGVVYVFGVVGLVLFTFQFYFALRYARRLPRGGGAEFSITNAIKGFLLYFALNSVTTGRYAFDVAQGLLLIAVLYCAAQGMRSGAAETVPDTAPGAATPPMRPRSG